MGALYSLAAETADIGMDAYSPVTDDYDPWENAFTGSINTVKIVHKAQGLTRLVGEIRLTISLCRLVRDAKRTLYCQYNVPVTVGMSLSFLASARRMSDRQSKKRRWWLIFCPGSGTKQAQPRVREA